MDVARTGDAVDLNAVTDLLTPQRPRDLPAWQPGDAWLAGGTWLFSEPQPALRRLIDLTTLGWTPVEQSERRLVIAATCTIEALAAHAAHAAAADLPAAALIRQCCQALLGSFKVWTVATVGGNVCTALPAGPMIALATALDAEAVIWTHGGSGPERRCSIPALIRAPQQTALAPGEILRAIEIPAPALRRRTAFRRMSLNPLGRSAALVIGTLDPATHAFALTITASTPRPVRLAFPAMPSAPALLAAIHGAVGPGGWHDDIHGRPDWRRHVTSLLAAEIRQELCTSSDP